MSTANGFGYFTHLAVPMVLLMSLSVARNSVLATTATTGSPKLNVETEIVT